MKNIFKKIVLFAGIAAMTVSCTDLDTSMDGIYTEFPNNPIAISGEFEGCYNYTRNEAWFGRNFWEGCFLSGDEAVGINLAGVYDDSGRFRNPSLHNFSPDNPGTGQMGDMLSGISYTNTRILLYGGADGKDAVVAPLRAIRAYYHFWMMELYGDVPILERQAEEGEAIERKPRADVAKWIESELLEVIPDLTETNDASTYGRPNKWMAEALLVKLYLNWGVYTNPITQVDGNTPNEKLDDCIYWCDQLTKSGIFEVGDGYLKKFYPDNGVHIKDFIYAVPFDPATLGGNQYYAGHELNRFFDFRTYSNCDAYTWGWAPHNTVAGIFILTPECVDRFNLSGDERNEMIAVGPQFTRDANYKITTTPINIYSLPVIMDIFKVGQLTYAKEFEWANIKLLDVGSESELANPQKGARCFKYPIREDDDKTWGRKQSNDIPVFRYADILLSKAECILRGGTATNGDTPASLMNQVRKCSHAPNVTGTPTLQDLLDERSREFILEPWRRNDLIRFGKWENCAKWKVEASPETMADVNKRLMPIPTGEMNTNTNWSQNPGY